MLLLLLQHLFEHCCWDSLLCRHTSSRLVHSCHLQLLLLSLGLLLRSLLLWLQWLLRHHVLLLMLLCHLLLRWWLSLDRYNCCARCR